MLRTIFVFVIITLGAPYALRGAFGALLLYLWVAYFRPEGWVWDGSLLLSLNLSFVSGVYLVGRSLVSGLRFRVDLRSVLLGVLFLITLASTWTSVESAYAWPYWVDFAKALVIAYLASVLITDVSQFRIVLLVISLSLGFEAAKQGWVGLLLHPGGRNDNILPMLGDNNGVAVGMLMLVPLFTALAKTAYYRWEKWIHQFLLIGVAYRAVSTYSRGAFLAGVAVVVIYIVQSNKKFRAAFGTLVVVGVVLSVLPQSFWDRMSTIQTSEEGMEDSSLSRLHFWRTAVTMAAENPVLGVGFNAYNAVYDRYDTLNGRFGHNRSVHSMWFGVLAELGFPGFLVFVTLMITTLLATMSTARRARRGQLPIEYHHYASALQTSFVACFVGGSFVPFQYTEFMWHLIGLSIALQAISMSPVTIQAAAPSPGSSPGPLKPNLPRLRPQPAMRTT